MADVNNNVYNDIGLSLTEQYNKLNHKYFNQQRFFSEVYKNPLQTVTPLYEEFWGPKVMTILIISRNYGWKDGTFNWPPAGLDESKQKIKDGFINWVQYRVLVWVDYVLSNKIMEATPDSDYEDQMAQVEDKMKELCAEMGDYGFEYMGSLMEGKDASFFKPYIDDFYNDKENAIGYA